MWIGAFYIGGFYGKISPQHCVSLVLHHRGATCMCSEVHVVVTDRVIYNTMKHKSLHSHVTHFALRITCCDEIVFWYINSSVYLPGWDVVLARSLHTIPSGIQILNWCRNQLSEGEQTRDVFVSSFRYIRPNVHEKPFSTIWTHAVHTRKAITWIKVMI